MYADRRRVFGRHILRGDHCCRPPSAARQSSAASVHRQSGGFLGSKGSAGVPSRPHPGPGIGASGAQASRGALQAGGGVQRGVTPIDRRSPAWARQGGRRCSDPTAGCRRKGANGWEWTERRRQRRFANIDATDAPDAGAGKGPDIGRAGPPPDLWVARREGVRPRFAPPALACPSRTRRLHSQLRPAPHGGTFW